MVARLADKLEVRHQVGKGSVESVTALYGEYAGSVKITELLMIWRKPTHGLMW